MIRVHDLSFSYSSGVPALNAVGLEIRSGERLAIIGANGSGKTTLARCLNGLHPPQKGTVEVDGLSTRDPHALFQIRRRVGMVFQNPDDQLVSTTVETEIAFGLENLAIPPAEMRARVDEVLATFHLEEYRHHPPHRLSGGEKQRVALAAAVALRPSYLVLDEPTALLDPQSRREVQGWLRSLRDRFDIATIHITQYPEEASQADRILVMHQGNLLYDAPPDELFADPEPLQRLGLGLPFTCALVARLRDLGYSLPSQLPIHPSIETLTEALLPHVPSVSGGSPSPALSTKPTPSAESTKLATDRLEHIYDAGLPTQHPGISDVSIAIPTGCIAALLGPTGSGKTTLAQHFNALLSPHRGRVLLDGEDIWSQSLPRIRQRVGLVFQFPELQLFEESVEADVAFGPRNLGLEPSAIDVQVTRALAAVGLPRESFGGRGPFSLSGGEKRRVALAGILAMDPEVLVLDEPTAGLDPHATRTMVGIFDRLRQQGKTLVLITHDMEIVAELATHVIVLRQGQLCLQGPVREVLPAADFADLSGLETPMPVRLAQALVNRGASIPGDLLTLEEIVRFFTPPASASP